ncbi:MAG: helical backbone metal receptor [Bacteroidota bacterium]
MLVRDQLNRNIEIEDYPKRIISLVPSQTELLVDLGLESSIIGVTKFCVHPKSLRKIKTVVGGTKQVHYNKIQDLRPDLVLCNKEENTKDMIERLEQIAPVHISDVNSIEDSFELIEMYGTLFNLESKSKEIIRSIKLERARFQAEFNFRDSKTVAYFIWREPWMVAANNTFINCMLEEAGFNNAYIHESRYPEVTFNDEPLGQVDRIFLSTEPYPFKESHLEFIKSRFPNKEVSLVDGEMFSWYGSRLALAYKYFSTI